VILLRETFQTVLFWIVRRACLAPNTGRPQTEAPKHREANSRGYYHGEFSKAVSATHAPKYANASQIKIMRGKKNICVAFLCTI
jgi:hypothetical protein